MSDLFDKGRLPEQPGAATQPGGGKASRRGGAVGADGQTLPVEGGPRPSKGDAARVVSDAGQAVRRDSDAGQALRRDSDAGQAVSTPVSGARGQNGGEQALDGGASGDIAAEAKVAAMPRDTSERGSRGSRGPREPQELRERPGADAVESAYAGDDASAGGASGASGGAARAKARRASSRAVMGFDGLDDDDFSPSARPAGRGAGQGAQRSQGAVRGIGEPGEDPARRKPVMARSQAERTRAGAVDGRGAEEDMMAFDGAASARRGRSGGRGFGGGGSVHGGGQGYAGAVGPGAAPRDRGLGMAVQGGGVRGEAGGHGGLRGPDGFGNPAGRSGFSGRDGSDVRFGIGGSGGHNGTGGHGGRNGRNGLAGSGGQDGTPGVGVRARRRGMGAIRIAALSALCVAILAIVWFALFGNTLGIGVSRDHVDQYAEGAIRLAMGAEFVETAHPPVIRDNEIALDLDTVRERVDPRISWDEASGKVTVTTRDRLIRMNTDNLTTFVNDKPATLDLPAFVEDGVVYVPMMFLSSFYQIEVSFIETRPLVIVDDSLAVVQAASVLEEGAVVREGRSLASPIVKQYGVPTDGADSDIADAVEPGSSQGAGGDGDMVDMYVFEQYDGWYKVRTVDGYIGYIEQRFVSVRLLVDDAAFASRGRAAWKPSVGKIGMVWEQAAASTQDPDQIPSLPGVDVVSPGWLSIDDRDGNVTSSANAQHIEWAHSKGMRVWAKLGNDYSDIDKTSFFLNSQEARENAIRSILLYSVASGIDGVNIDIENVYLEDKDALTQFARELAPMLREQGLDVSMCVGVPDGSETWSLCYDTPALADAVDYITLMAYDQYVPSGTNAGSAAQYAWVEAKLARLIEHYGVPSEKLILGVPFYSRVWEMKDGAERGGEFETSSALYMSTAINNMWQYDGDAEWDEESGQFFCNYSHDGADYQMWLEDPASVDLKLSLIHKYGLAGAAAWSREFAISSVWDVFNRNLKQTMTYAQWQSGFGETSDREFPARVE